MKGFGPELAQVSSEGSHSGSGQLNNDRSRTDAVSRRNINLTNPKNMKTFTVGIMAAAVFWIAGPAFSAVVSEHFYGATYNSDLWMETREEGSSVTCEPSFCNLTNGGGLALKVSQWRPPVELRAVMVGYGEVRLTIASNCWGGLKASSSETSFSHPNGSIVSSPSPPGTSYDFHVRYDGTNLYLFEGVRGLETPALPLDKKSIRFESSVYAKLDYISVSYVPLSPRLTITRSEDNVILMWPTDPPGFTLQSTTDLTIPESWVTVSKDPVVVNGSNVVTEPISGLRQFYRLEGQ